MIIANIFLGVIVTALGVVVLKYNFQLVGMTGNVGFAERYLGAGGTYLLYKMIGVVMVIGGLMYATGLAQPILSWLLSPLAVYFPSMKQ